MVYDLLFVADKTLWNNLGSEVSVYESVFSYIISSYYLTVGIYIEPDVLL